MQDWLKEFVNDLYFIFGITALASTVRTILTAERRSFIGFVRANTLAFFVGIVVWLLTSDLQFLHGAMRGGIIAVCAVVAEDILFGIINLATFIRKNPRFLFKLLFKRKL